MSLIPQPTNISVRWSVEMLQLTVATYTHEEFDGLRQCIREQAIKNKGIDTMKLHQDQDPVEWQAFLQVVVAAHPGMEMYENCWPIKWYYDLWIRPRRTRLNRNCKAADKGTPYHTSHPPLCRRHRATEGKKLVTPKKQLAKFIGKIPPHLRNKTVPSRPTPHVISPFSLAQRPPLPSGQSQPPFCISPSNTVGALQDEGTYLQHPHVNHEGAQVPYPVACLYCGYLPAIPPACNIMLRDALGDISTTMLPSLASLGIVHDYHLRLFMKWKESDRIAFFKSFPTDKITPLDKFLLKKRLGHANAEKADRSPPTPEPLHPIPKPHADYIQCLMNPDCPSSAIKEGMGIEDDDLYQDLTNVMDVVSRNYLSASAPLQEWNEEQWDVLIKEVCMKRPFLRRYEDQWPIKIYLSWRSQRPRVGDLDCIDRQSASTPHCFVGNREGAAVMSPPRPLAKSNAPTIWRECTIHTFPDTSKSSRKLQHLLQSKDLEELLPAFVAVGIKTDEHLDLYSALDEAEKISIFLDQKHVQLNQFQLIMLKMAFRCNDDSERL